MSSLKHKTSSEDGNWTHSLPMTKDFMGCMFDWSLQSCPLIKQALSLLQQAFSSEGLVASDLQMDWKEWELVSWHLEQLAFNTTAWTLWMRQMYIAWLGTRHQTIVRGYGWSSTGALSLSRWDGRISWCLIHGPSPMSCRDILYTNHSC